jgi:hypothetical protein
MDIYEEGIDEAGIIFEPASAVVEGGWLIVAVLKFWFQEETRIGDKAKKHGLTVEHTFGNEIRLALPLVDNPDFDKVPENCITMDQLKIALKAATSVLKENN